MRRRTLLMGGVASAALFTLSTPGWAKGDRPPKLTLRFAATFSRRREPVNADAVGLRFALFESPTARNPIWDETQEVKVRDGRIELELGKRSLGTTETNTFPDELYLQVQVLQIAEESLDAKLSPRMRLDWGTNGSTPCMESGGSEGGLDDAGCILAGPGALKMVITELQRLPPAQG
ncbi:MAG: hypothetical protein H6739_14250 [Alphaproteobacteria bacterium]|nr:hypothetical protein [Alphaproteobacteria bacterium]